MPVDALRNKHVCFIAGTLGQGGAEKQLCYMLEVLKRHEVRLTVLSLTRGEYWESTIVRLGIPVLWVGRSPLRALRMIRILRELRHLEPDVVQSAHFYTNLYAATAGKLLGIPSIGALRSDCTSEVASLGKVMGMLSLRMPDLIAANSQAAIANAVRLGMQPSRLYYLPNALFLPAKAYCKRNGQRVLTLLAVGRLVEQKRIDRFIRLIARLHRDGRFPIRGIIVGTGPKLQTLRSYAQELGLTDDVIVFRGALTDMDPIYASADVFVLTSDWEGTPNVVLEAMAHGLPVLATRVGGVPALIQHDVNGILIKGDDEEELLNQVYRLMQDHNLRIAMGERAREFVTTSHSTERLEQALIQLYARILDGRE